MDEAARGGGAAVNRAGVVSVFAVALTAPGGGCGDLKGLGGAPPPLVTFNVMAGGVDPGATRSLQVALVWGAQWLTEPFCILRAESDQAAAVIAPGSPHPFRFLRPPVAVTAPPTLRAPPPLPLFSRPSAT